MTNQDIIGAVGVGLILLAYFLNTFSLMPKEGRLFFLLNMVGSGLACYASILIQYTPFILLEAVWCIVSMIGLIRKQSKTVTLKQ